MSLSFLGLLLLSCGSGQEEAIRKDLAKANRLLHSKEAKTSADDVEAIGRNEKIRDRITTVENLLLESEYDKAEVVLDGVLQSLEQKKAADKRKAEKNKQVRGFGLAYYRDWESTDFKRLTGNEKLEDIQALKTEVRAAVILNLPDGSSANLTARSEMEVRNFARGRNRLELELKEGNLSVELVDLDSRISVKLGDCNVTVNKPSQLEMANFNDAGVRWLVSHKGIVEWSDSEAKGKLTSLKGIVWNGGKRIETETPLAPRLESPKQQAVFAAGEGQAGVPFKWFSQIYIPEVQLQVSDTRNFVTRIYDRSNISGESTTVDLDPGEYFWRIRGFSEEKAPGPFSKAMKFSVRKGKLTIQEEETQSTESKNVAGPKLTRLSIEALGYSAMVQGKVQEGVRVKANGVPAVILDDGTFSVIIEFKDAGLQNIRVVAIDENTGAETVKDQRIKIQAQ